MPDDDHLPQRQTIRNNNDLEHMNSITYRNRKHKNGFKNIPLSVKIETINSCLPQLINKCRNATVRLAKYIRMTMEIVENIIPNFQNLRVIHLLRDPRAMMDSQLRKNDMNVKSLPSFVKRTRYMCARMKNDLDISERLRKSYQSQIYTLRYEDLADNPLNIGQRLFRFIGVPFSSNDKRFITSTSLKPVKDSKYRAGIWRNHITQKHLQIVDRHCHHLYKRLGYRHFTSIADVRNLAIPDHFLEYDY
jgi:hypothetical protein